MDFAFVCTPYVYWKRVAYQTVTVVFPMRNDKRGRKLLSGQKQVALKGGF